MVVSSTLSDLVKIEEAVELLDTFELALVVEGQSEASVIISDNAILTALCFFDNISADSVQVACPVVIDFNEVV